MQASGKRFCVALADFSRQGISFQEFGANRDLLDYIRGGGKLAHFHGQSGSGGTVTTETAVNLAREIALKLSSIVGLGVKPPPSLPWADVNKHDSFKLSPDQLSMFSAPSAADVANELLGPEAAAALAAKPDTQKETPDTDTFVELSTDQLEAVRAATAAAAATADTAGYRESLHIDDFLAEFPASQESTPTKPNSRPISMHSVDSLLLPDSPDGPASPHPADAGMKVVATGNWRVIPARRLALEAELGFPLQLLDQDHEADLAARCAHAIVETRSLASAGLSLFVEAGRGSTQFVVVDTLGSVVHRAFADGFPKTGDVAYGQKKLVASQIASSFGEQIELVVCYGSLWYILEKAGAPVIADKGELPASVETTGRDFPMGFLDDEFAATKMLVIRNVKTLDGKLRKVTWGGGFAAPFIDLGSGKAAIVDPETGTQSANSDLPGAVADIADLLKRMIAGEIVDPPEPEPEAADTQFGGFRGDSFQAEPPLTGFGEPAAAASAVAPAPAPAPTPPTAADTGTASVDVDVDVDVEVGADELPSATAFLLGLGVSSAGEATAAAAESSTDGPDAYTGFDRQGSIAAAGGTETTPAAEPAAAVPEPRVDTRSDEVAVSPVDDATGSVNDPPADPPAASPEATAEHSLPTALQRKADEATAFLLNMQMGGAGSESTTDADADAADEFSGFSRHGSTKLSFKPVAAATTGGGASSNADELGGFSRQGSMVAAESPPAQPAQVAVTAAPPTAAQKAALAAAAVSAVSAVSPAHVPQALARTYDSGHGTGSDTSKPKWITTMTRAEAEEVLRATEVEGGFIVRPSSQSTSGATISVFQLGTVKHHLVDAAEPSGVTLGDSDLVFTALSGLASHFGADHGESGNYFEVPLCVLPGFETEGEGFGEQDDAASGFGGFGAKTDGGGDGDSEAAKAEAERLAELERKAAEATAFLLSLGAGGTSADSAESDDPSSESDADSDDDGDRPDSVTVSAPGGDGSSAA